MAWPTKQHYLSHINEIPPWEGGGEKKTPSRSLVSGVHVKIGTRSICLCKCQTPVLLESVRKASKIIQHLCHEINQPSATLITQRTKQRGWGGIKAVINFSPDIFVKTLTSSYTRSLLKHIWLTGAPSVTRWVISFPQRGAKRREEEGKVLYLLSVMTSGLAELVRDGELGRRCSVSTDSNPARRCQCPFRKHWLLHFQGPNLCKQSLFSLSFKLISSMNITFQRWTRQRKKKKPCHIDASWSCMTLQEK